MPSSAVVRVNVRNVAVGGAGVGEVVAQSDGEENLLGITAFVPFSAVGEVVSARVLEQKKRYLNTELLEIEARSSERVEPECRHFTVCGGCELQHMSYPTQLKSKLEMIRSALKAGRLPSDVLETLQPITSASPYGYRRRIALHIDRTGNVGFYRANSRSVVPIEQCPIAVPQIEELLSQVREFGRLVQGKITSILLEADGEGVVAVLKSPYDLGDIERQGVLTTAKNYFSNITLMVGEKEVGGFGRQILELPLGDDSRFTLRVPAGYFTQVNWEINRKLISRVIQLVGSSFGRQVFDLYAGAGNFALPLAKSGAKVTAVETDRRLISFGRETAIRHKVDKNIEFVESSVEKFLLAHGERNSKKIDCIVADPPRSGLGKLVSDLSFSKRLLFISCHLPSFVRDIRGLVDQGWKVNSIEPFDMFAQTSYVEILASCER